MLDSSILTFSPFTDNRAKKNQSFTGQSGPLLLGTDPVGKKYLIKHTYAHNAANEYVVCWLAEKLGVPVPHVHLLTPHRSFNSEYAVAIEYLNLEPLGKDTTQYADDLIAQFALAALIDNDDSLQLNIADGHVVSYDFSECFSMADMNLLLSLLRQSPKDEGPLYDMAIKIIQSTLSAFRRRLTLDAFDIPGLARQFNLDYEKMRSGMIAVAKRALTITEDEIKAMSIELENLYPCAIAIFYEECILSIQNLMRRF